MQNFYGINVIRPDETHFTVPDLFRTHNEAYDAIKKLRENPLFETYRFSIIAFHLVEDEE